VGSEPTQDLDGLDLNVVIGILHAIEEHQKVLVARDERIKVRIQTQEHSSPNIDVTVGGGCHKEFMHQFVHLDLLLGIKLLLVLKLQTAECLYCLISNLRILVEEMG
jgi:hypothetical protein